MRSTFIPLFAVVAIFCLCSPLNAQEFKEHITKEFTLQKDATATTVLVYNLFGSVKVEGYSGDKVVIDIDKSITADDNQWLERGKKELQLGFDQNSDSIVAYISEPWDTRPHTHYYDNNHEKIEYHFRLEYTVKVPYNVSINVGTINNGTIDVKGVNGKLCVNNVNGGIKVTDAKGTTKANTVNGTIEINYVSNPPEASSFHTINGDIRLNCQPGLSADMQFKTMHGEFYTDYPEAELLPVSAIKNVEKTEKGTEYRLSKNTTVRFGSGGKMFKLETLNGNVYIKKQS